MIRGALAAAVTPLRDGGASLDEAAVSPLVAFLARGGLDGLLALGTTGEGIMLSATERRRAAELFVGARPTGFSVVVHCGAQTTAETTELCRHAAEVGADGVAVIGPPYFRFDQRSLRSHFTAAAAACDPVPFYVYEFAARSGYAIPPKVIHDLREEAPNLRGIKVSDTPLDAVEPYLIEGLDVFVGAESLVLAGMERGAVGAVSGLATAFPEIVGELVRGRGRSTERAVVALRQGLAALPIHSALKCILAARGVPVRPDVRAPLRIVSGEERARALELLEGAASRIDTAVANP